MFFRLDESFCHCSRTNRYGYAWQEFVLDAGQYVGYTSVKYIGWIGNSSIRTVWINTVRRHRCERKHGRSVDVSTKNATNRVWRNALPPTTQTYPVPPTLRRHWWTSADFKRVLAGVYAPLAISREVIRCAESTPVSLSLATVPVLPATLTLRGRMLGLRAN